jgi:hypothetical protein
MVADDLGNGFARAEGDVAKIGFCFSQGGQTGYGIQLDEFQVVMADILAFQNSFDGMGRPGHAAAQEYPVAGLDQLDQPVDIDPFGF